VPVRVPAPALAGLAGGVTVAVRPERLTLLPAGADVDGRNAIDATVVSQGFAGNLVHVTVRTAAEVRLVVEARPGEVVGHVGEAVRIAWAPDDATVLTD
jgi:ABC-type Fe3+/spermidine/putrescine transport system ATPase subunit